MVAYVPKVALDVDGAAAKVAQKPSAGPGSGPTARSKGSANTSAATTPATCAVCSSSWSAGQPVSFFVVSRCFTPQMKTPLRQGGSSRQVADAFARLLIACCRELQVSSFTVKTAG